MSGFRVGSTIAGVVDCPAGKEARDPIAAYILDNAGKWASREVSCHLYLSDQEVTFYIANDGPGMTVKQAGHPFDVGSRFDESKSGSGLGLAIARDIARDAGG
jgi:signal transduction histidine kinase